VLLKEWRDEKGRINLQTSLRLTKFVMHFKLRFVVPRLSRLRLRLGFDLFSHSFHNLIKKTSLVLHGEQKRKTAKSATLGHKRNFPIYGRRMNAHPL
jgi:hypothetical protein